jgi:anti-sigma B factor antagonist
MNSQRTENLLVVTLSEDLTAASAENLKNEILGEMDPDLDEVYLDLGGVEMVDSTGISLLISIQNSLKKKSGTLSLLNTSDDIVSMFKLMRLDKYFQVSSR